MAVGEGFLLLATRPYPFKGELCGLLRAAGGATGFSATLRSLYAESWMRRSRSILCAAVSPLRFAASVEPDKSPLFALGCRSGVTGNCAPWRAGTGFRGGIWLSGRPGVSSATCRAGDGLVWPPAGTAFMLLACPIPIETCAPNPAPAFRPPTPTGGLLGIA